MFSETKFINHSLLLLVLKIKLFKQLQYQILKYYY